MNTILVVEDELFIREDIQELLESEGYYVLTAKDGNEGYEIAKNHNPDLILSDIRMPVMDGIKLLNKLQESSTTSTIPFIFLSAKVEMEDIRSGMLNGADDYVTKPFKAEDILRAIRTRLKKKNNYYKVVEELQNKFIKNVPHELRTPLISILGFSELIETDFESLSTDELKDMANRINRSGKRLHRRVEKLIQFAYLLSSDANSNPFAIIEIIPSLCLKIISPILDDFGRMNDLKLQIEKGKVKISYNYFEVILRELIENAIKFSESGTAITVTGKIEANTYLLEVGNKSEKVTLLNINEIEPFNKIDPQNENKEGLGMGLAIVKRIVELADGDLLVENDKSYSTKIKISFPLVL